MTPEETFAGLDATTTSETLVPPAGAPAEEAEAAAETAHHLCAECAGRQAAPAEEFVYAIGKLDVRFPSIGIEREFEQRQARLVDWSSNGGSRGARVRQVLEANRHLAARMCYVFMIGGIPAYVVAPTNSSLRDDFFEAITHGAEPDRWCTLVGRRGPMAAPSVCGGVIAPIVGCDQLESFSIEEWRQGVEQQLTRALDVGNGDQEVSPNVARELFEQVVHSTENLGATDGHRALNYLLLQHPGLFLAAVERSGRQQLERIETRIVEGLGSRRLVAVILTFVDLATGVPERLFARVDITEEWPFVAEGTDGGRSPLGLRPFVENALLTAVY